MPSMVHLLVQNTRNQNIRITNRIKNGMSLKFNAHYTRNGMVVTSHIWHSGQRLEKCLKCVGIMVCLSFTKFQERIIINPGEVFCRPFGEFIHDVSVFFVLQYPAVI